MAYHPLTFASLYTMSSKMVYICPHPQFQWAHRCIITVIINSVQNIREEERLEAAVMHSIVSWLDHRLKKEGERLEMPYTYLWRPTILYRCISLS